MIEGKRKHREIAAAHLARCDRELAAARAAMAGELTPSERFGAGMGELDWLKERFLIEAEAAA